ncbi:MAG: cell division protein ZapA [Burkholderiales bacterium]|nr:cell division protein ZapA [Burkholderiales bacterium]MDE2094221.1 cell division protein ZapA [Burkholderiales bacterium]MDE2394920.1 cell division protein ZapA [Burkholderiales bacterium]MDE2454685.1 cell division protein ZapA [Burkholderiales bacterium]
MKQVEVTIMGQGYILGCPEGGENLLATAVAGVDREMSAIRDGGKVKARERIAVLAALNLAYQLAERGPQRASSAPAASNEVDLDALVDRIDAALGADGHLL